MPKGAIPFDITIADPKERLEAYLDRWRSAEDYHVRRSTTPDVRLGTQQRDSDDTKGFDALLMRNIRVVSASAETNGGSELARCMFHLQILPGLCNPMSNMHGGAVALLADMSTTMATAPISKPGWWEFGGVSRTLQVTYLKPVVGGTTVEIECFLRGAGKRLSTAQCLIKDRETGTLLAMAEHGKAALEEQRKKREASRL